MVIRTVFSRFHPSLLARALQRQPHSISHFCTNTTDDPTKPSPRKKSAPVPRVTLISPDESISVVTLEEAKKLSRRRDLKLVKIVDVDSKNQRPTYKLMQTADYHNEDVQKKGEKKTEKVVLLSGKISQHDLEFRIKNIAKWIEKKYEVRVVISGEAGSVELAETVFKHIEEKLAGSCRIVQKRMKGQDVKFQIIPLKAESATPAAS